MRFLLILAAKLDQAPAASLRQQCTLSDIQVLLSHILDETTIEALQSNRLMGQYFHNMIGCNVGIWISKHQERAGGGPFPMLAVSSSIFTPGPSYPNKARATLNPFSGRNYSRLS